MKNIFKIMGVALIASSMLFVSCNKDPEEDNTPIEETTYTVKVTCNDNTMGTVTITPAKESYKQGDLVIIKAVANDGFRFVKWNDGTEDIATENYEWTVTGNKTFTATFEAIPQPSWSATFDGSNINISGFHQGRHRAANQLWLFQAAQAAQGTSVSFPYVVCYIYGSAQDDLQVGSFTELYMENYYTIDGDQYGDWQHYETNNFNCTALDLTENMMSATLSCEMYSLTEIQEETVDSEEEATKKTLALTFENITFTEAK